MILQEQECAFLFVESGVNEGEAMLEAPHLLPAVPQTEKCLLFAFLETHES